MKIGQRVKALMVGPDAHDYITGIIVSYENKLFVKDDEYGGIYLLDELLDISIIGDE